MTLVNSRVLGTLGWDAEAALALDKCLSPALTENRGMEVWSRLDWHGHRSLGRIPITLHATYYATLRVRNCVDTKKQAALVSDEHRGDMG